MFEVRGIIKIIKKIKPFQKIEVKWLDVLGSVGWLSLKSAEEEMGDIERLTHCSIGYFLKKTHYSIVICQSYQQKMFADGNRNTDQRLEIPLKTIREITIL